MNELHIFNNRDFGKVRVINKGDQPWFVAKDVCDILGLTNPSESIKVLDDEEKSTLRISEGGPEANIINESGLYYMVIRSNKPDAKTFRKWITSEVIPSIRKTGGYVNNEDLFINTYLPYADESTKAMFKNTLEVVRKQNESIQIMQPKADYFDALVNRNLLTNIRDTAKELKVKEKQFIEWLLQKYCYRDNKKKIKPYAQYCPSLFELKEFERHGHADNQTLITPRGRETFRLLLIKDGLIETKESA